MPDSGQTSGWIHPILPSAADDLFILEDYSASFQYCVFESTGTGTGTDEEDTGILVYYNIISITCDKSIPHIDINVNNSTVGSISGYFDMEAFGDMSIYFLDKDKSHYTVKNFDDIPDSADEICSYTPPMHQLLAFNFTVTAQSPSSNNTVSAIFPIICTFNWTIGKDSLTAAIQKTQENK